MKSHTAYFLLILLAGLVVGGLLGIVTYKTVERGQASATSTAPAVSSLLPDYYTDSSSWQAYRNSDAGVAISYPIDFPSNDIHVAKPETGWRADSSDLGFPLLQLDIPRMFESQSNFLGARITIGRSNTSQAAADCLSATNGEATGTPVMIGGTQFYKFTAADAGAGNLYSVTSYRTMHSGYCYALETVVHSTHVENYPAEYHLHEFNQARVDMLLNNIVKTFTFI